MDLSPSTQNIVQQAITYVSGELRYRLRSVIKELETPFNIAHESHDERIAKTWEKRNLQHYIKSLQSLAADPASDTQLLIMTLRQFQDLIRHPEPDPSENIYTLAQQCEHAIQEIQEKIPCQ